MKNSFFKKGAKLGLGKKNVVLRPSQFDFIRYETSKNHTLKKSTFEKCYGKIFWGISDIAYFSHKALKWGLVIKKVILRPIPFDSK